MADSRSPWWTLTAAAGLNVGVPRPRTLTIIRPDMPRPAQQSTRFLALLSLATCSSLPSRLAAQRPAAADFRADWALAEGFTLRRDAQGFHFPTSMVFVPEPGPGPKDPLYFVTVIGIDCRFGVESEHACTSRFLYDYPKFLDRVDYGILCFLQHCFRTRLRNNGRLLFLLLHHCSNIFRERVEFEIDIKIAQTRIIRLPQSRAVGIEIQRQIIANCY